MKKLFTFGGVLYSGIGCFIAIALYARGSDSAYDTEVTWVDAFEAGVLWPWQFLQAVGISI